jgi:hypothetical protein
MLGMSLGRALAEIDHAELYLWLARAELKAKERGR